MITLITIFIGAVGACIAWFIDAPAPFLTGPATLVTISALLSVTCTVSLPIRNISFVVIGIATAEGINSDVLINVLTWPISLIGMCFNIIILVLAGKYIFQTYFKMERNNAILASTPGHLSFVLSLSEDNAGNTAIISLIQSIRVLTLTLALPGMLAIFTDFHIRTSTSSTPVMSYTHVILIIILSIIIGFFLLRFRVPAAFLLGGMLCSTIGHGFNLTPGEIPENLAIFAFVVLGSLIGSRFSGISLATFKSCILKGTLFTSLSLIISVLVALVTSYFTNFRFIEILIAIAPGGLETMIVMGQLIDADPAFIAFHHLARLFLLLLLLSIMIRKVKKLD